jgi:hypothetical protein
MRRLTLILSDLYLPEETGGELPQVPDLPCLEWLLSRANSMRCIDDWRRWLALQLDASAIADLPLAHVEALSAERPARGLWLATPVMLEARLDHVRLSDRGLLRLSAEQGFELCAEFEQTFGPELSLVAGNERRLLLAGGPDADIPTVDPARLLGSDIAAALPRAPSAGELRRLGAEIEMWLPGTRTNAVRARAGQRKITALWLWGGGRATAAPPGGAADCHASILFGGDSFLAACANLACNEPARPVPSGFAALGEGASAYVELSPISGDVQDSLEALEANWFAPARAALATHAVEQLSLVANDRVFDILPNATWKFWRRGRHWLELLKA